MLSSRFLFLRGLIAGNFKLRGLLGLFGLMLSLSIGLGSFSPLWSQTPLPSNKDACVVPLALCADIQSLAQEDVVDDIPRRTAHAIDLFKEKHPDWQNDPNKAKREVSRIYDREYSQREKTKKQDLPSIWKKLTENGFLAPFLGLVLLALAGWFKDGIGKGWTTLTKKIDDWVYGRFAGTPFFESLALKRYREALVENYQELKIPFRVNHKPLDMSKIYVPLKVAGSSDSEQVDAYGSIAKYRRLVIKGIPGSGKTMLLRHVAFAYGKGELMGLENRPVPVLLELHRLSDADLTEDKLIGAIVEAFKLNRFPKAERFVRHSLEQGKLMLLLDGLDEVNSKVRLAVAQKISDLLQSLDRKQGCRLIVTCRTAVYSNEFAGKTDQMLEVVEFTDQQMRRFLDAWKTEIPVGKSIDQLIQTLRDRPRIMSLARNPLLLTIIVHLYTDPAFELPRSRAEFYQESTRILLDQWQDQFNKYRWTDKRRVLQQLALYQQKTSTEQLHDRRSMEYTVVLEQIGLLLPSLSLKSENDSIPLLNELVERSGLFLKVDGGDRYQFSHLTLQEYFAAVALTDKSNELIQFFKKDPTNWLEVVKLWCGIAGDSTSVITQIRQLDEILAFECLADAQEVDQQIADTIVSYFQRVLGNSGKQEEIAKAFGSVAASDRTRGRNVFSFLQSSLNQSHENYRYGAIAQALSFTNRSEAAKVLAPKYGDANGIVSQCLIRMGDLAVPELVLLAEQHPSSAIRDLYKIGTIDAAEALVSMLLGTREEAHDAAWYLASLIMRPEVREGLSSSEKIIDFVTDNSKNLDPSFDWIWQPFKLPYNNLSMVRIVGQIASEINLQIKENEQNPIDTQILNLEIAPQISIPLFAIQSGIDFNFIGRLNSLEIKSLLDRFILRDKIDHRYIDSITDFNQRAQKIINSFPLEFKDKEVWRSLLKDLPPILQLDLFHSLLAKEHSPNRDHWKNIFEDNQNNLFFAWRKACILLLLGVLAVAAFLGVWNTILSKPVGFITGILAFAMVANTMFWLTMFWLTLITECKNLDRLSFFTHFGTFGLRSYNIKFLNVKNLLIPLLVVTRFIAIIFILSTLINSPDRFYSENMIVIDKKRFIT